MVALGIWHRVLVVWQYIGDLLLGGADYAWISMTIARSQCVHTPIYCMLITTFVCMDFTHVSNVCNVCKQLYCILCIKIFVFLCMKVHDPFTSTLGALYVHCTPL